MWILALILSAVAQARVPLDLTGSPDRSMEERLALAKDILRDVPLIDGHNDLPWNIRDLLNNNLDKFHLEEDLRLDPLWSSINSSHTDLPRLREGMLGAQFWVAFIPCSTRNLNPVQLTIEQIDVIKGMVEKYGDDLEFVVDSQGIMDAFGRGKIASLIGVEGGHSIASSLAVLRMMYELGVRYLTLTHNCDTPWASSNSDEEQVDSSSNYPGLTDFGKKLVLEMNRLGMMVDLSHVSVQTMRDALSVSKSPVIYSHSSARAICDHKRNVPDELLRKVTSNGGVVMVNFYSEFLSCRPDATLLDVVEHIEHIRNVSGIDHVGIGSDYDGVDLTPVGLEDSSKYPYLIAELLSRTSWTVADIRKLTGENLLRVFRDVERVRDEMKAEGVTPDWSEIDPDLIRERTNCSYIFDINSLDY